MKRTVYKKSLWYIGILHFEDGLVYARNPHKYPPDVDSGKPQ